jgi:hypothetical protein
MALNNLLDRLVTFEPTPFPVISVYLNTQADQNGRDNFDAFVRSELKSRAKRWTMRTPERQSFDRDAERINEYLRDELRASSNGAAIFACSAERDFFEAVQFDAPIEENHLYTSYQPSATLWRASSTTIRLTSRSSPTPASRICMFSAPVRKLNSATSLAPTSTGR